MKTKLYLRFVWAISVAATLWTLGSRVTLGQFKQNKRDTVLIDSKTLPKEIANGYHVFAGKCSECHGLDISLKTRMAPVQWDSEVKRMQAMASSQFNNDQASAILKFLNYDEAHRKAELSPAPAAPTAAPSTASAAARREFYFAQNCDTCHSIAGKGGTLAPLDSVGTKLSRQQLVHRLQAQPMGSAMPPLAAGTTDAQIEHLADFLLTLTEH